MKLTELLEVYRAETARLNEEIKIAFTEELKEFFKSNPEVKTITWTQYAPYFNDGDPCEFRVYDPIFSNAPAEYLTRWGELDDIPDDDDAEYWTYQGWGKIPDGVNVSAIKELSSIIMDSAMEKMMESVFGSDSVVTVTKDGIKTDYCEHD